MDKDTALQMLEVIGQVREDQETYDKLADGAVELVQKYASKMAPLVDGLLSYATTKHIEAYNKYIAAGISPPNATAMVAASIGAVAHKLNNRAK